MTEDKDTTAPEARKSWQQRNDEAKAAVAKLSDFDLAALLSFELDRRRLDASGDPTSPDGLYLAAITAINALLGVEAADLGERARDAAMVKRLVEVGQHLYNPRQSFGAPILEIATFVDALVKTDNIPPGEKSSRLARTMESRFEVKVDDTAIEMAMAAPTLTGKVTRIAFAVGLLEGDVADEITRRDGWNRVGKELRKGGWETEPPTD
jgi:hypothetical protein